MDTWPTGLNSFSTCQHVFFPKIIQISNMNFAVCKVNNSRLWRVKDNPGRGKIPRFKTHLLKERHQQHLIFYCNFSLFPSAVQSCGSAKQTKVLHLQTVPNCWRFYNSKTKPGDTETNSLAFSFNNRNMDTTFTIFSVQGNWEITECCARGLAKIPTGLAHSDFRRKRKINSMRIKQIRLKSLSSHVNEANTEQGHA